MSSYPPVGEIFELTLTKDQCDGMKMVRNLVRDPKYWRYNGQKLTAGSTAKFKLVKSGFCDNFQEAADRLKEHGEIPAGQWLQAFKAAYPEPDGSYPVGVADCSWEGPGLGAFARFPYLSSDGVMGFIWPGSRLGEYWRWLVLCK